MIDRVDKLLFSHLFHSLSDAEFVCKFVDIRALLREHLAHFEYLLAYVLVSIFFDVIVGVFSDDERFSHKFHCEIAVLIFKINDSESKTEVYVKIIHINNPFF